MTERSDNRRLSDRIKVHWHARVASDHGSLPGRIIDISMTGAFLETDAEFKPGDTVKCRIDARIDTEARELAMEFKVIRRVLLSGMRGLGYGMQLMQAADSDREFLLRAITSLPIPHS